jgi:arabinogalactan oligomer/maltooligosaccharide transport system substrate-binding protein
MLDVLAAVTAADPVTKVFADAATTGQLLPAVPQLSAVWGPLGAAEAAIIDGADPASTMADAAARIAEDLR